MGSNSLPNIGVKNALMSLSFLKVGSQHSSDLLPSHSQSVCKGCSLTWGHDWGQSHFRAWLEYIVLTGCWRLESHVGCQLVAALSSLQCCLYCMATTLWQHASSQPEKNSLPSHMLWSCIMLVTSHCLCHILLIRSKSQILLTPAGERYGAHEFQRAGSWRPLYNLWSRGTTKYGIILLVPAGRNAIGYLFLFKKLSTIKGMFVIIRTKQSVLSFLGDGW